MADKGGEEPRSELERLRRHVAGLEETLAWEAEVNTALAGLSRQLLSTAPIDDISYLVLEHAKRLTGSRFGFVGYIDPETGYMISPTLTRDIWDACDVKEKSTIFRKFGGLWGWVLENRRSLMTNDPRHDPRSGGTPQGHLPIERFLSAPALSGDDLMGQIALANADRDYTERDVLLVELLADYYALAIQRERAEETLRRYSLDLEERIKELRCLYGVSSIIEQQGLTLEEILERTVEIVPPGWRYSDVACARITLDDREYSSDGFRATAWMQSCDIIVYGEKAGAMEVCYLEEKPEADEGPFIREERELINALAERLGRVAERKGMEEALLESEDKFRSIVEQSSDGIVLINQQGVIVEWNRAQEEIVGIAREEALGKFLWDVQFSLALEERRTPQAYEALKNTILELQGTGGAEWFNRADEREIQRPDGQHRIIESVIFPIQTREGYMVGSITRNITEGKRAEEELRRINRELDAYAHVVSHDLRGPISIIISASDALQEMLARPMQDDNVRQIGRAAEIIRSSADSARQLVEDLLSLAQAGQAIEEVTEVDVCEVIQRILKERSASIAEKGMEVVTDGDLGRVTADPTHIYQLFSNLIGNAVRYNDSPDPRVTIAYEKGEGGLHRYRVWDNGPGIPTEDLEKVFAPLFKGKGGGTGIGLAIAKKVVDVYEGQIRAYNEGGVCFEFTLRDGSTKQEVQPID